MPFFSDRHSKRKPEESVMQPLNKRVLFDAKIISQRVAEIGKQISKKYPEGNLLLIGILKGAFMFMADLVRNIDVDCQVDFVRISSVQRWDCHQWKTRHTLGCGNPCRRQERDSCGRYRRFRTDSERISQANRTARPKNR